MKISKIFASLLFVGTIFAFAQCTKDTAQPKQDITSATIKKPRDKSGNGAGITVAQEVNGVLQYTFTQQKMKSAIENAFFTAHNTIVRADSTVYIVDELNPQTNETEYTLLFPITMPDNTREYIGLAIAKKESNYKSLGDRQRSCGMKQAGQTCECRFNFWGACVCTNGGSGGCVKSIIRTYLAEQAESELTN